MVVHYFSEVLRVQDFVDASSICAFDGEWTVGIGTEDWHDDLWKKEDEADYC